MAVWNTQRKTTKDGTDEDGVYDKHGKEKQAPKFGPSKWHGKDKGPTARNRAMGGKSKKSRW